MLQINYQALINLPISYFPFYVTNKIKYNQIESTLIRINVNKINNNFLATKYKRKYVNKI